MIGYLDLKIRYNNQVNRGRFIDCCEHFDLSVSKTLFQTGVDGNEPVDVPPALRGPIPVPLPGRLRHAEAVAVKTLPSLASGGPPGVDTHFHIPCFTSLTLTSFVHSGFWSLKIRAFI